MRESRTAEACPEPVEAASRGFALEADRVLEAGLALEAGRLFEAAWTRRLEAGLALAPCPAVGAWLSGEGPVESERGWIWRSGSVSCGEFF
ncbi:MAG: hypothetical protein HYV07_01950 [Deltaproteobacteria bacterium]|nr:hypothetical protein [Deltaproteobacteria bacterium]